MKKNYNRDVFNNTAIPDKIKSAKMLLAFLITLFLSTSSFAQSETALPGQIGEGESTSVLFPINCCYSYNYSQQIYLASELQEVLEPGNNYITKIKFNQVDAPIGGGANYKDWVVYLQNTTTATFDTTASWESNLEVVYDGAINVDEAGWIEITLQNPFLWDGTSNIVVGIDENTPGYYLSCNIEWASFDAMSPRGLSYYSDVINPNPTELPLTNSGIGSNIPQIIFESTPVPSCLMPSQLSASNFTNNSVELSWISAATVFDVEYGPLGFIQGEGQTVYNVSNPFTLTGITLGNSYSYYVRAHCGIETSAWQGGYDLQFDYCAPTTAYEGDYIMEFATNNALQNVSYSTNTYDGAYHNKKEELIVQVQGLSFDFTDSYYEGGHRLSIWVDWNNDFQFSEEENVYTDYTDGLSLSGSVQIPLETPVGNYTMRVRAAYSNDLVSPCDELPYGSALDYTLQVMEVPLFMFPTNIAVSNLTLDQATIGWNGTAPSYEYIYKTISEQPQAEDAVDGTVEDLSVVLTNLTEGTRYYFWVRAVYGEAEKSDYISYSFKTGILGGSCDTPMVVETFPYSITASTCGLGDNYGFQGETNYGEGEDMVFQLNITTPGIYAINLTSFNEDNYIGWFLKDDEGCSDSDIYLDFAVTDNDSYVNSTYNFEEAGTYYLIVDTYPDPLCSDFKLEISLSCDTPGEWIGGISDEWENPVNWCGNMVPELETDVIIAVANPVVLNSFATANTITLSSEANLRINGVLGVWEEINVAPGGVLTVADQAAILQGPDTVTNINTGITTVEKNTTPLFRQDYTLWSSPVANQNLRGFSPATLYNRFYSYNTGLGSGGDYEQEIVTTADANAKLFGEGKGYLIRTPNNWVQVGNGNTAEPYEGTFSGVLNNGTINVPLSGANTGMNLVGNPYASPISIEAFFTANSTNVQPVLYFWSKPGSAAPGNTGSGYVAYNYFGNNVSPETRSVIDKGQGFFVVAEGMAPSDLIFTNNMRTINPDMVPEKSGNTTMEMHRYWLRLSNATNTVGSTLIGYATGATQGVDSGYDAAYFNDSPLALTSLINNNEYSIQGRALPFVDTDVVPLGFKTDAAGSFTISLSNFDGMFAENQDIFLKDNTTNTVHNLKIADYAFTTEIGVFNTRFEVQYNSTLRTNNPTFDANAILVAVKDQQIKINAGNTVMEKIEVIDVAGRVIYTVENVNAATTIIDHLTPSNQMLILKITTTENEVVNQKIVF